MYTPFFGLTENPFLHPPGRRHIYMSARLEGILAQLITGIESRKGILIVVGEPGTGKTTLAHALVEEVASSATTALILQPPSSLSDFFKSLFQNFNLELQPATTAQSFRKLRNFLVTLSDQKAPPVLVVDEAHQLSFDLINAIHQLNTLEVAGVPLLQIVLIGQPGLHGSLRSPQVRPFRQRVAAGYVLRPLSAVETRRYITHHLRRVGGNARSIFHPKALRAIYTQTGGVPSRINRVCDRALLTAYVAGRESVDRRIVRGIGRDPHLLAHHRVGGGKLWLAIVFLLGFIGANPSVTMRESTLNPDWIGHLHSSLRYLQPTFSPRAGDAGSLLMTTKEKPPSVSTSGQATRLLPATQAPPQSEMSTIVPDRNLVSALLRHQPMTSAETNSMDDPPPSSPSGDQVALRNLKTTSENAPNRSQDVSPRFGPHLAERDVTAARDAPRQAKTHRLDVSERQEKQNLLKAKMDAWVAKYTYKKVQLEIDRLNPSQRQQLLRWLQSRLETELPSSSAQIQKELDQLAQERDPIRQQSPLTTQESLPLLLASVEAADAAINSLPPVSVARRHYAETQLTQRSNKTDMWFHNLFECEDSCAPLLNDIMDIHVEQMLVQPHAVILFDLGSHHLKAYYQQKLDALLSDFNPQRHQVLLIGRSSPSGSRGYNIILSGKRAGEIKDYIAAKYKIEPSRVRYRYLGDDLPQLTLDSASLYGVRSTDLAVIDTNRTNPASNKVNQSVAVVIYQPGQPTP